MAMRDGRSGLAYGEYGVPTTWHEYGVDSLPKYSVATAKGKRTSHLRDRNEMWDPIPLKRLSSKSPFQKKRHGGGMHA